MVLVLVEEPRVLQEVDPLADGYLREGVGGYLFWLWSCCAKRSSAEGNAKNQSRSILKSGWPNCNEM